MKTSRNGNDITLEFEGTLLEDVLQREVTSLACDKTLWNIFIILPASVLNGNSEMLSRQGFVNAGNLSVDNSTFCKLRYAIRTSGEAGGSQALDGLTCVATPIEPSDNEKVAIANIMSYYSDQNIAARLAMLERRPEPVEAA
jgi:hypothetical protein